MHPAPPRRPAPPSLFASFVAAALALAAVMPLGACSKPIPFKLADTDFGAPLEGVRIYRHSVSFFTPLPTKRPPVETDFQGDAVVPIPPNPTCLTFLRQGYEPTSIAVFRTMPAGLSKGDGADDAAAAPTDAPRTSAESCPVPSPAGDPCAAWQRILRWDDLMPRVPVAVRMRPLRSATAEIVVVDEQGAPLADCEVLGATFLYLPIPGVEPEWGFPALQRTTTDAQGRAFVQTWSGFRNRITARSPERGEAWIDVDGAEGSTVRLSPKPLLWRTQQFRVVDGKGRPIPGVQISYGEIRNGLPASPNAFVTETDRDGMTPMISLPNADPLLIRLKARGWKDRTAAPLWRALEEGGTWRVVMEKR